MLVTLIGHSKYDELNIDWVLQATILSMAVLSEVRQIGRENEDIRRNEAFITECGFKLLTSRETRILAQIPTV